MHFQRHLVLKPHLAIPSFLTRWNLASSSGKSGRSEYCIDVSGELYPCERVSLTANASMYFSWLCKPCSSSPSTWWVCSKRKGRGPCVPTWALRCRSGSSSFKFRPFLQLEMVKGPWTFTRLVFIHCHGGKLFLTDGQFYLSAQILHIPFYDAEELKWNVRGQKSRHYERVWSRRPQGFCSCRKAVCSANGMHGHGALPSHQGPAGARALYPEPQESSSLADACINQLWELEGNEAGWRGMNF